MVMQHIYLIRHGTTEFMEAMKVQGSTDSPLSAKGRREAQQTSQALSEVNFQAAFCSPLGRTKETAGIICASQKILPEIIDDLREMDFGWYEGSSDFKLPGKGARFLKRMRLLARLVIIQASGERLAHVKKRARESWKVIQQRCPEGSILIVAHGVVLNYLLGALLNKEQHKSIGPVQLKPCSISEILLEDHAEAQILRLNSTNHLTES
jgi:probable phosphoglycerate mutase